MSNRPELDIASTQQTRAHDAVDTLTGQVAILERDLAALRARLAEVEKERDIADQFYKVTLDSLTLVEQSEHAKVARIEELKARLSAAVETLREIADVRCRATCGLCAGATARTFLDSLDTTKEG